MATVQLPVRPSRLQWANEPAVHLVEGDDALTIRAGPRTDLFTGPTYTHDPMLLRRHPRGLSVLRRR